MPNQVTITSIFGLTPPFSAYCCNVYGNQCVYVGSGVMPPITITLPPQFNTAPAVGVKIISHDCERFEIEESGQKFPKEKIIELAKNIAAQQEKFMERGDYDK